MVFFVSNSCSPPLRYTVSKMTHIDPRFPRPPKKMRVPLYPNAGRILGFCTPRSFDRFLAAFADLLHAKRDQIICADSASNALYVQLANYKSRSKKDTVKIALPAYNCTSVIDAVVSAGCEPVLVDVGTDTHPTKKAIDYMIKQDCDMFLWPNFFGTRRRDEQQLSKLKKAGIHIVFDEAQSFPFSYDTIASQVEEYAYAVLISFGRSKPLAGCGGGALYVVSDSVASTNAVKATWGRALKENVRYCLEASMQAARWRFPRLASAIFPAKKRRYRALDVQQAHTTAVQYKAHAPMKVLQAQIALKNLASLKARAARHAADYTVFTQALRERSASFALFLDHIEGFPAIAALSVDPDRRHLIMEWFTSRGIQVRWYYLPLHMIQRYSSCMQQPHLRADVISASVLIVPFSWSHTAKQKQAVLKAIKLLA